MRYSLFAAGLLTMALFAPAAVAVEPQCFGREVGEPGTDEYECVGAYFGDETCVGVYHTHPNPGHPDGCNGSLPLE